MFKKILTIVAPITIGCILIYFAFNQFTENQIKQIIVQFSKADYKYILISLLFACIGYVSRAYRWLFVLEQIGYKVPFKNSLIAVCISYLMNLTIPRSGEVTRAALIAQTDQVPFQSGFGSIVAERIIDLLILLSICSLVFIFNMDLIYPFFKDKIFLSTDMIPYSIIILAIIFIGGYYVKKYAHHIISKIKNKISGFTNGLQAIRKLDTKFNFILHTLIIWGSYLMMFYITIFAFPETSTLTFPQILTTFVIGSFAVVLTNGGFGAYPLLISKTLFLYGIPETVGTSFGWILWSSQIILILILGSISFIILPLALKRKKE